MKQMIIVPVMARPMPQARGAEILPQARGAEILSRSRKWEMRAQNTGLVHTITTELATDVYVSEAIQVAK